MSMEKSSVTRMHTNYMKQYDAYVERQKLRKKRLYRRLVFFSIIAVLAIGSMTVYHLKQRSLHAEKQEQYEELQEELASLQHTESNLTEEISLLKNEEYILEIARSNYFFSKEGELIFKIPDEEPSY
ncbi:MAG TPA: septum formation initiator family protein [Bacillota bacterium]|nr:septum formation initiator family protein [Bacillota bacterium]